ncbi:MAG: hypothetical protein P4L85_02750 [Paludisphaera borealis]|nr:hypothetical protein [Paludisphaera borealis]MDR3618241.1 hypothetical protein [Paludisphaera borealis]
MRGYDGCRKWSPVCRKTTYHIRAYEPEPWTFLGWLVREFVNWFDNPWR